MAFPRGDRPEQEIVLSRSEGQRRQPHLHAALLDAVRREREDRGGQPAEDSG